jgi:acetyl esterase/lipase
LAARSLALFVCATLPACVSAPKRGTPPVPPPAVHAAETFANVPYAQANGHDLLLDLYLPDSSGPGGTRPRPVIVFLHGGGWRVGDKSNLGAAAAVVAHTGYALASVNYRLSGEGIFPTQIIDCKAAVRWLRANARHFGLDPARIGVLGFSAGGHLAALLGTTANVAAWDDPSEGNSAVSSRVQAVCDVSGPVNLAIPTNSLIGKLSVYGELGGSAAEKPDLVRAADPSRYVRAGDPPFFIIQGDQDTLVAPAHAQQLYSTLRARGVEATLDMVSGGGHVPFGPAQQQAARTFFTTHFGRP